MILLNTSDKSNYKFRLWKFTEAKALKDMPIDLTGDDARIIDSLSVPELGCIHIGKNGINSGRQP